MVRVWPLAKDQRISCIYFVHAAFLGASLGLTKFHLRSCCLFYQMRSLVNSYSFLLERKLLSIFNWLMPKTFIPLHTMVSELIIMTRIMFKTEPTFFRVGQGGGEGGRGGSSIPVYPKKVRQNTPKYPKFIQIYPKLRYVYFIPEIQRK